MKKMLLVAAILLSGCATPQTRIESPVAAPVADPVKQPVEALRQIIRELAIADPSGKTVGNETAKIQEVIKKLSDPGYIARSHLTQQEALNQGDPNLYLLWLDEQQNRPEFTLMAVQADLAMKNEVINLETPEGGNVSQGKLDKPIILLQQFIDGMTEHTQAKQQAQMKNN